jgi:hypothetical protein
LLKLPANLNEPIDLTNFIPKNKLPKFETRNRVTFPEEEWNKAWSTNFHRQVDKIIHEKKIRDLE